MKYFSLIAVALLLFSCSKNPLKVDVSNVKSEVKLIRFDQLLFQTTTDELEKRLTEFYIGNEEFTDICTGSVLRIGYLGEEQFMPYLNDFISDTVFSKVADAVLEQFSDMSEIEQQIEDGFKHYSYYFPKQQVPKVYTYFSGFNQAIFTSDHSIAISLDNYLGRKCIFYNYLGIPQYKIDNMYPEKMVADVFYSWAISQFPNRDSTDNLLSNMIYQGKLHYFSEAMCPDMPDTINIGFSKSQLTWCKKNEAMMWTYLVENKLLYSVDRLALQKYLGDAPFTNSLSPESPGRTGVWVGWQIVRAFMKNNEGMTLNELMLTNNAQQILAGSRYFPE